MIQIYKIYEKQNSPSPIHSEVCRDCANDLQQKGFSIEIDGHLQKYVSEKNGISFYWAGGDGEDPEIECSICGEYLISDDEFLNEGILNQ